jgi:hypothetical protein
MATGKICDAYGGTRDVRTYEIRVTELTENGSPIERIKLKRDYGKRGFDRLERFVKAGTTKPDAKAAAVSKPGEAVADAT